MEQVMYEQLEIEVVGTDREELWDKVAKEAENYFGMKLELLQVQSAYVTRPHSFISDHYKMSVTVMNEVTRG